MLKRIILSIIMGQNPFSKFERRIWRAINPFQKIKDYRQPCSAHKTKALSDPAISNHIHSLPKAKVLWVVDGDTVIVSKRWGEITIRLDSIDCPEDGQYWGDMAKSGLIKLVGNRHVHIEAHGIDSYRRTLATIHVWHEQKNEWLNVNERMVTLGHAWVTRRFYDHLPKDRQDKLNRLEGWARSRNVGLWHEQNPMPPWVWRSER